MSYADRHAVGEKSASMVASLLTVSAIGYALVSGLAMNVARTVVTNLKMVEIALPPPPPPKPPPPPPQKLQPKPVAPPIVAPPPIIRPPVMAAPSIVTIPTPPLVPPTPAAAIAPAPPAPPPAPPKPNEAAPVKPRGNPANWLTTDDYPPAALRAGEAGRTKFRLTIGVDGQVTGCSIVVSSGFGELDQTACRLLQRRGRFAPAKNAAGVAIASTYTSSVLWRLPQD